MMGKMIKFWHMKAKKQGICGETGKVINLGDLILFPTGGGKAVSENSIAYKRYHDSAITGHKDCGC
tara:strand:- start:208 stop:405 length:198 start_codon:yes stop_codon:yes gene_type:complete